MSAITPLRGQGSDLCGWTVDRRKSWPKSSIFALVPGGLDACAAAPVNRL